MTHLELSDNAQAVLRARYLMRDRNLNIVETPAELFRRVARHIAQAELIIGTSADAERWQEIFLQMLTSLDFLPNSPTLMNAGTSMGQLSACFVIPVEDTMEGIFNALKQMALVQRSGGGAGFSFSKLRPASDPIVSTGGEASGPVSFMKIFDCTTTYIKQGGKRRGANMGVLRVDHPDILDFIRAKEDGQILRNFNLSVAVTHSFMNAVMEDDSYDLVHPADGHVTARIKAADVFQEIVQAAWQTGDPGLLFMDTVNQANPTPHVGYIEATNPCGEIPLLGYESCNLGSINLSHMLKDNGKRINMDKLLSTVRQGVRFLDNVISVNRYPVREIETATKGNRKIGLGVMGFSEMLIRMGISYASEEAEETASYIMQHVNKEALRTSKELAAERGHYPNWKGSVHDEKGISVRNATRTAIAPTGTIGIIADTTPSIEPLFALAYRRVNVLENDDLQEVNPLFRKYADKNHLNTEHLVEQIMEKGTLKEVKGVPEDMKHIFMTALEIPIERHLAIQAAFQRHVDNSVSKTVNIPEDATPSDVSNAYRRAWMLGLKGIAIYRYGSRSEQVLQLGAKERTYTYAHGSKCDPEECRI
ncbi:MAG: adenosylcobalamin-dependent ribonucleoside-diphosphate reductase [Deltaproteobacteria bacterium]|nr:adenosylcobalamin-dependent ribonucleoside-diphosphate reductase [Deltaproteobacteria bacterium]